MVWNCAGRVGLAAVIFGALAFTAPALAMGQGGGKPPKDDPPTVPNPAIVYQSQASIVVADIDGSNEIAFESNAEASYRTPSWSRDGNSILFAATCPQGWGIYRVSFDREALDPPPSVICADLELITTWPAPSSLNGSQPMESPDGTMIAYAGGGVANGSPVIGNDEIFIVHDGTPTNVTNNSPVSETWPSWSPDGERLAIRQSFLDDSENDFTRDVAIIRIDPELLVEVSRVSLLDALAISDPFSALLNESNRDSITRVMWSNTEGDTSLVALDTRGDIWILEFEISIDPVFPFQDVLQNLTALNLTESSLTERRATWSPDDTTLLYHAVGKSGCGDEKRRITGEFVVINSLEQQPAEGCEGSVIIATPGGNQQREYPHWWPNHQPISQ